MSKLNGRVAVVTGASKGIGAEIARAFAYEGAGVVVNYASSREGADKVVEDIVGKGGKAIAVQGNVARATDVDRIFASKERVRQSRHSGEQRWRLLLEGDKPAPLGSRALEILIVLLERPGELVSKQELIARVWPDVFVEPANLTVHISALRRTLRDGRDGNRFIINIPGRGYSFVAPVVVTGGGAGLRFSDGALCDFDLGRERPCHACSGLAHV